MQSGTERGQGHRPKGRARRALRAGAVAAIVAATFCIGGMAAAAPAKVEILPLDAARSADAAVFATYLAQEASRSGALPFAIGGALGTGEGGDGAYLVAVIDIADEAGRPLHRLVSERTFDDGKVDERALRLFAAETAGRIAQWYAAYSPAPSPANEAIVTGSIAAPASPAFAISFGPAPGDGAAALTRALDAELKARAGDAPWLTTQDFSIEGSILTASRSDGRTDVSIHWLVKSADGQHLGEIHQKNALDAARIAGSWGEVAESAARAAADGVVAVLQPAPERIAANG